MGKNQNNPSNYRKGQSGPRSRPFAKDSYPLDVREQELRSEIDSPEVPAIYKRVMTMDNTAKDSGVVNSGRQENKTDLPETWDSVAPLTENNMHAKFVKTGIEPDDGDYDDKDTNK